MSRKIRFLYFVLISMLGGAGSGPALAACPGSPLINGQTANANDVMDWLNCKAPSEYPDLIGRVTIQPAGGNIANPSRLVFDRGATGSISSGQGQILYQHNGGVPGTNEAFVFDTGTSGNDYRFKTGGADRLVINGSSGDMGLGAAPTLGRFQIDGSGNQVLSINSTNDDSTIRLYRAGTMKWRVYNNSGGSSDTLMILDSDENDGVYLSQNSNSWTSVSDVRLKRDVRTLTILDKLASYRAVSFDWRSDGRRDLGVIAQELDRAFPELVHRGDDRDLQNNRLDQRGIWSVDYSKLSAVALGGVKELHAEVTALRAVVTNQADELRQMRERLSRLERSGARTASR